MLKKRSYRGFSPEFRREAIKRVCDEGMTDMQPVKNSVSVPDSSAAGETNCIFSAQMRSQGKEKTVSS